MPAATRVRGITIHIGSTAATAATDTYTEIGGAKMVGGSIGPEFSEIDTTTLVDVYKQSVKGVADAGDVEIGGNFDHADTGQTALATAADDDDSVNVYNVKIVIPNARQYYLKARVMSFRTQFGTNTNVLEFRSKLSLVAKPVEAAVA